MNETILSGQIIMKVQKAIIESPSIGIFDQKWFVAILSSLLGVIVGGLITYVVEYQKEKNKQKKILQGLLREINYLIEYYKQQLPVINSVLNDLRNGKRVSLLHPKLTQGENYNIYLKSFIFLEDKLDADIYLFFKYFESIDSASIEFGKVSERYRIDDEDIKKENIMSMLEDIIDKIEKAKSLGRSLVTRIEKYI